MKKAFTMIELIFVIVIIGILAAVAIPKLMATRTDAKASTLANEVQSAVQEISSYITATGKDVNATPLNKMSQVLAKIEKDGNGDEKNSTAFEINSTENNQCVLLETNRTALMLEKGSDWNKDLVCKTVWNILKNEANYTLTGSSVNY